MIPRHHLHSSLHRGLYCVGLIVAILIAGTVGLRVLEGFSTIDAFYFSSMIATGQGPAPELHLMTTAGKLFTCALAFISAGAMVASLGFLFGPFLGTLWRVGVLKLESEFHHSSHSK